MEEDDDRDDLSTARGLFYAFKISMVFYALMALILYTCSGCGSIDPIITKDRGEVVSLSEKWVEVAYQVVNRQQGSKALNIYYKECGHSYSVGDQYPDKNKEIRCPY